MNVSRNALINKNQQISRIWQEMCRIGALFEFLTHGFYYCFSENVNKCEHFARAYVRRENFTFCKSCHIQFRFYKEFFGKSRLPSFALRQLPSTKPVKDYSSNSATKCPAPTSISFGRYCSALLVILDFKNRNWAFASNGEGKSPSNFTLVRARSIFGSGIGAAEIRAFV